MKMPKKKSKKQTEQIDYSHIPRYMFGVGERVDGHEVSATESARMSAAQRMRDEKFSEKREREEDERLSWEAKNPNMAAARDMALLTAETAYDMFVPQSIADIGLSMIPFGKLFGRGLKQIMKEADKYGIDAVLDDLRWHSKASDEHLAEVAKAYKRHNAPVPEKSFREEVAEIWAKSKADETGQIPLRFSNKVKKEVVSQADKLASIVADVGNAHLHGGLTDSEIATRLGGLTAEYLRENRGHIASELSVLMRGSNVGANAGKIHKIITSLVGE